MTIRSQARNGIAARQISPGDVPGRCRPLHDKQQHAEGRGGHGQSPHTDNGAEDHEFLVPPGARFSWIMVSASIAVLAMVDSLRVENNAPPLITIKLRIKARTDHVLCHLMESPIPNLCKGPAKAVNHLSFHGLVDIPGACADGGGPQGLEKIDVHGRCPDSQALELVRALHRHIAKELKRDLSAHDGFHPATARESFLPAPERTPGSAGT